MKFVKSAGGPFVNFDMIESFRFDPERKVVMLTIGGKERYNIHAESEEDFLRTLEGMAREQRQQIFEENRNDLVKAVIEAVNKDAFVNKPRPTLRANKPDMK